MEFPAAMTVRTVAFGSSRRSWTPSSRNPERFDHVTTAQSSSLVRSMIISAKVLTESPYRVDMGDGDAALQPSDMTVGLDCSSVIHGGVCLGDLAVRDRNAAWARCAHRSPTKRSEDPTSTILRSLPSDC